MPEGNLVFSGRGFSIESVAVGGLDNNVFLIADEASGQTVIVDAADDPNAIIELVAGRAVQAIITTHGHWDHLRAAMPVSRKVGTPFLLHPADAPIAEVIADGPVEIGAMAIGGTVCTILHTPGHTPGSVCVALDGVVITGDTLFPGGPGATRFPYASFPTIIESIRERLFTMADDTVVLPGHGRSTTMGAERPHLADWVERGW